MNKNLFEATNFSACIDIGANSAHLLVASYSQGYLTRVESKKYRLQLLNRLDEKSVLVEEGVVELEQACKSLLEIACRYRLRPKIIATHLLRAAKNGALIAERLGSEFGVDVEVLSADKEGEYSALGMQYGLHIPTEKSFVGLDIGGGSTEIFLVQGGKISWLVSLPFGHLLISTKFFTSLVPSKAELKKATHFIKSHLELNRIESFSGVENFIVCGGVGKALAGFFVGKKLGERLLDANACVFSQKDLRQLLSKPPSEKLLDLAKKKHHFFSGGLILSCLGTRLQNSSWQCSSFGIREGFLLKQYGYQKTENNLNFIFDFLLKKLHLDPVDFNKLLQFSRGFLNSLKEVCPSLLQIKKTSRPAFQMTIEQIMDACLLSIYWEKQLGLNISECYSSYFIHHVFIPRLSPVDRKFVAVILMHLSKEKFKFGQANLKVLGGFEKKQALFLARFLKVVLVSHNFSFSCIEEIIFQNKSQVLITHLSCQATCSVLDSTISSISALSESLGLLLKIRVSKNR